MSSTEDDPTLMLQSCRPMKLLGQQQPRRKPNHLRAVVSDCGGVHPEELPVRSAAQQSPGGRTATLKHCVQMGPLEQPLFGKPDGQSVGRVHISHKKQQRDDKYWGCVTKHLTSLVASLQWVHLTGISRGLKCSCVLTSI